MDSPVTFSLETITPEAAAAMLKDRPLNRRINPERVRGFSRALKNGQWKLNGQPIILSPDGELLDGQHRLSAIIDANTPAICAIAWGVSKDAMPTIDSGKSRSGPDILKLQGHVNTNHLAALASLVYGWTTTKPNMGFGLSIGARPHELLMVLDEFPELPDYLGLATRLVPSRVMSPNIAAFCLWLFTTNDAAKAENFIASLGNGEMLSSTDPIYRLRESLLRTASHRGAERRRSVVLALTIKAWNLWLKDRPCHMLKLREGESFPVADGCYAYSPTQDPWPWQVDRNTPLSPEVHATLQKAMRDSAEKLSKRKPLPCG